MSEDVREFAASKDAEEYVYGFKSTNDSAFDDFINDGLEKAREIINADKGTG